jgi:hypothetical protein
MVASSSSSATNSSSSSYWVRHVAQLQHRSFLHERAHALLELVLQCLPHILYLFHSTPLSIYQSIYPHLSLSVV